MAVEERVIIKVEVNADVNKDLAAVEARLKAMDDSFKGMGSGMERTTDRVDKNMKKFKRAVEGAMSAMMKFLQTLAKFAVIGIVGQLGLFTAALLGVKAVMASSRLVFRGYELALQGVSYAAAAVATGLAVAAAAMREFKEAQLAPYFGGGVAGKRSAASLARSLGSQTTGLLGGEAASGVVSSFAKAGIRGSQANVLASQLYNLTGGDAKTVQSIATALAGKDVAKASEAVQGAAGFKQGSLAGVSTMSGLIAAISSGSAIEKSFADLGDVMGGTLFGTFKTQFESIKSLFADMGEPMLGPVRKAFLEISKILHEDVLSLTAIIQRFGADRLTSGIVRVVDNISDFIRTNIVSHLTTTDSLTDKFMNMVRSIQDFYYRVKQWFVALEPASNVIMDMFRAIKDAAVGTGSFQSFSDLVEDNSAALIDFGTAVGNVLKAVATFLASGQTGFFAKLPVITETLNKIAERAIPALGNLFSKFGPIFERMPEAVEGLARIIDMLAPIAEAFVTGVTYIADKLLDPINTLILVLGGSALLKKGPGMAIGAAMTAASGGKKGGIIAGLTGGLSRAFGRGGGGAKSGAAAYSAFWDEAIGGAAAGASAAGKGGRFAGMLSKASLKGAGKAFAPLAALELIMSGANAYSTGETSGGGALGAALAGGAIGAGFAGIGAPIGALIGGGLYMGAAALGRRQNRKDTKKSIDEALKKMNETEISSDKINELRDLRSVRLAEATMIQNAMVAGNAPLSGQALQDALKPYTKRTFDFKKFGFKKTVSPLAYDFVAAQKAGMNTPEFERVLQILKAQGVDISDKKTVYENLAKYATGANEELDKATVALNNFDDSIKTISETFDLSADQVVNTAKNLGIELTKVVNQDMLKAIFQLATLPKIDRTQGFLPDFATSPAGQAELLASANASLNALAGAVQSGKFDTSMISDFINNFAQMEVALGGNVDIAGLSGLFEVRQQQGRGVFGGVDVVSQFDIAGRETQVLTDIAKEYGISAESLISSYTAGGTGNYDVNRVSKLINSVSKQRDLLTKGILSGDFSSLAQAGLDVSGPVFQGFRDYIEKIPGVAGKDLSSAESIQQSLVNALGSQGAQDVLSKFLVETSKADPAMLAVLNAIKQNTDNPVSIYLNGEFVGERGGNNPSLSISIGTPGRGTAQGSPAEQP